MLDRLKENRYRIGNLKKVDKLNEEANWLSFHTVTAHNLIGGGIKW